MNYLLDRLRTAIGGMRSIGRFRRKIAEYLLMPWEAQTVFPLQLARYYPRFMRGHDNEADAAESIKIVEEYTMTKYDRCVTLNNIVKYVEDNAVPGVFVECGVWKGGSSGIMALANLRYGKHARQLHLFDAWTDEWPNPTAEDGERYHEALKGTLKKAQNQGAFEACQYLLGKVIKYPSSFLFYYRGLFKETFSKTEGELGSIAILRLDADWYESTKLCLEQFFPKVVPGGIIVIDDYGYCAGAKRAVDEYMASNNIPAFLNYVDYSCRYLIKRDVRTPLEVIQ